MALVELSGRRIRRNFNPDHPVEVAPDNPLAAGLVCLVHPSSVVPVNLMGGLVATRSGSGFIRRPRASIGHALAPAAADTTAVIISPSPLTYPYTFFAYVSAEPATTTGPVIAVSKAALGNNYLGLWSTFTGLEYPTYRGAFGAIDATDYQLRDIPRVIVGVSRSATAHELWVNGVLAGSSAGTGIALDATFNVRMGSGQRSDGGTDFLLTTANVGLAGAYNRALSGTEIASLSSDVLQLIQPKSRRSWVPVSAGGATLSGDAATTSTASGSLTTSIPLAGAALGVSAASGQISTAIPLGGNAASISVAGGALSALIQLGGAAVATAAAAADLTAGGGLSGAAQALASGSADLTIQIRLSGAALATALATGGLTTGAGLSGAALSQASASGALATNIPLTGAALTVSGASGNLTSIIQLSGVAASVSSAIGSLDIAIRLNGAAVSQALAGGDLTARIQFDGAAVAQAAASGAFAAGGLYQRPPSERLALVGSESRRRRVLAESRRLAA